MANKHIKVINGRRYYYESIRQGKKVISKYLGPVDGRLRKYRKKKLEEEMTKPQEELPAEESYIG